MTAYLIPPDPMQLRTTRGYNFGEVSSAMQKAIRRGKAHLAGYWALELWESGFGRYVWKRLLTVSAEDCWGIALLMKILPVILLCQAKKSRDADHLQNFVYDQKRGLTDATLAKELRESGEYVPIPDYAYDCHTAKGKKMGRTKADFFKAEQKALQPFQPGLFDHLLNES